MVGLPVHIERALDAACSAPSHDNAQPWRFWVEGDTISFAVDASRDAAPEGMARLAVGAAVECVCIAAARMGATVRFGPPREGAFVTLSLSEPKRIAEPDLARTRRVTNRRVYDAKAIDDATFVALQKATPPRDLAHTYWFGRERVRVLGPMFEEAEELFWLDGAFRERALGAIHFVGKDRDEVQSGLSLGSLELSAAERAALVAFHKSFVDPRVHSANLKTLAARARRLVESASGVCVIATTGSDPMADVDAGRAMQRAWMALTQKGLSAHPMTSILALARGRSASDPRIFALTEAFRRAFPNVPAGARIVFVMRFGNAQPPTCRVGRLPLAESVSS
jgi:nitroreductase